MQGMLILPVKSGVLGIFESKKIKFFLYINTYFFEIFCSENMIKVL